MSTHPHTKLFTQVDRTKDPDFFVRFMDEAQRPEGIQASKRLMLERMALAPGAAVLEVGCGPGTDVFELVDVVGPTGRLVGLDASEAMIAEARRRAGERRVAVTFEVGDVEALPFPDATFVLSYCDSIRNGWIGRQLPRLFREQGLEVLSIDPVQVFVHYAPAELFLGSHLAHLQASGTLSPDQARRWWEYLQHADRRGTLLIGFTTFVVVGARN